MTISVVIPAHNGGATLRRAVESVLAQTLAADEIVIVDDGSTDNTAEVAESFGDRVRLIRQQNQGASAARNNGVQAAHSEWVAFLDADDRWMPEKLQRQREAIAATPGAVLCYTGLQVIQSDGSKSPTPACPVERVSDALRLGNPGMTPSCVMLPRAVFQKAGGFDGRQIIGEDWDLWLRMMAFGPFCAVQQPLIFYYASNSGLSANADLHYKDAQEIVESRTLSRMRGLERFVWRGRILSFQALRAAMTARDCGEREKEQRYMVLSLSLWPSPFWHPLRYKAALVTLRNSLLSGA